ncbi:Mitochondrial distribution and morphology protein 31, mitochondrial precursor [Malassezia yamatoensis]|uniref:Mitochondrial distribution and morphology protein 31, mitochondrial n=1 Tax=Malassezia yamatoensis TaxID=253288 RepID=A0AAJ5YYQ6_9BASI|nr:Mitochondrial distribution and morphology protein 31, mitochondrial precursor [Malassezia yamatoensis]
MAFAFRLSWGVVRPLARNGPLCLHALNRPTIARPMHWTAVRQNDKPRKDDKQPDPFQADTPKQQTEAKQEPTRESKQDAVPPNGASEQNKRLFENYPHSLRELALKARSFARARADEVSGFAQGSMSSKPSSARHTPTQEDLLRIARGFWTRMRIRFKWFTIRGFRRYNADEIGAFFTLGGLGTAIWVIVGTYVLNLTQDHIRVCFTVAFGSAITPKWREGRISFRDVVVTRQSEPIAPAELQNQRQALGRGEQDSVHPGLHLGLHQDIPAYDTGSEVVSPLNQDSLPSTQQEEQPDKNFSLFELRIDSLDVQLSLRRWLDGHGLIHAAEIRGVRGIIDRRNVYWDPEKPYDPRASRRKPRTGDLNLSSLTMEDFLVTVYQPGNFRPFNASIFEMRLPRLRVQWLFYDLLNADSITGQIDGCLFSLHKPQSVQHTSHHLYGRHKGNYLQNWSRLRVDGVNIDHVQKMSGMAGPLNWIYAGRFDMVADIKFPREYDKDADINRIISEILENLSSAFNVEPTKRNQREALIPGQPELSGPAIYAPVAAVGPVAELAQQQQEEHQQEAKNQARRGKTRSESPETRKLVLTTETEDGEAKMIPPSVIIELDVRLKDIKASMPIFTRELSYSSYALARPVVAFMNAHKTLIPVNCRIVMDLSEFDGSLDLSQTGLLPLISRRIYDALANHVASLQANQQRVRNVSLWSLDLAAQGMLKLARNVRDTMSRQLFDPVAPI